MPRIHICIVKLLLFAFSSHCFSQTETFDMVTYIPPKDWKKNAKQDVVNYTTVDSVKGSFCVITIYASTVGTGDAQKDFNNGWKDLIVTPFKAGSDPKTQTQTTHDGWKVVSAAAPVKVNDTNIFVMLSVISGFGKTMNIRASLNDQSYAAAIDALFETMELDKSKPAMTDNTNTKNTQAGSGKFGLMRYSAPAGWNVTKYPDGDILIPADLPKGEVLQMWVQESFTLSGTMEQALQKSYDETAAKIQATKMNDINGGNYSKQAAKISFRGWEYIRCSGGIHIGGGDYPLEYGLDLFVIKMNGRFEKISILKSRNHCSLSTYYPSDRLKYYNDIENFLFSLQFADWKEPDIKAGNANGDGITGDWQGISLSVGLPKPGAELGAEYKAKHLIFFSNGQALFTTNFPIDGLDEINTWIKAENNRRDWGTYTFSNGRGVLKLPYADIPLRMENGKLIITTNKTDHGFIKTNSVDGARFNGTYVMSSKDIFGGETGITPLISFTSDGKFTDNGALKILFHEYVDCLNPALMPGSGIYDVKKFSILFNYTDGRKIKLAFPGRDYDKSNQSPATLYLSYYDNMLKKQ